MQSISTGVEAWKSDETLFIGWLLCSVRCRSRRADLLTLGIGKPASDQEAGIGMNGRSAEYGDYGKRQSDLTA